MAAAPSNSDRYFQLAIDCRLLGMLEDAVTHAHRAIELQPKYFWYHAYLGTYLRDLGRFEEALSAFHRARELRGMDDFVAFHIRSCGRMRELAVDFEEAIAQRRFPAKPEDRLLFAWLCCIRGRPDTAADLFEELSTRDPRLVDNDRYRLPAALAAAQGDGDGARNRALALRWLRAELQARRLEYGSEGRVVPTKYAGVLRLLFWPELAGVRAPDRLGLLPAAERAEWRAFWVQVRALRDELLRRP